VITKIKNKVKNRKLKKAQYQEMLKSLPTAFDEAHITWTAPEHPHYEKGKLWKIMAVSFVLVSATFGVIFKAWTFSLAVVAFALAYYIIHRSKPQEVEISLSDIGIKVGKRKYPFNRIKSFWIIYEPPFIQTLHILVHGEFVPEIEIQIPNQDPAYLRDFLIDKIPEIEGRTPSLSTVMSRLFKI